MPSTATSQAESTGSERIPAFACATRGSAGAITVSLTGELDVATVSELDHVLRRAEADAPLVVLDLRGLEFVDSWCTQVFLAADRRIRRAGGRLVVVRGPAEVQWLFELIGLDRELEMVDYPPTLHDDAMMLQERPAEVESPTGPTSTQTRVTEMRLIVLPGRVDAGIVGALQRQVTAALSAGQGRVVVDLSAVTVLGKATLASLCAALRGVSRRGARVALVGLPASVRGVMERCAIDGVDFYPTLRAAADRPPMSAH